MVDNLSLTQKQETFTLNLYSGMYQRDAYIDAYKPTYSLLLLIMVSYPLFNVNVIIAKERRKERLSTL